MTGDHTQSGLVTAILQLILELKSWAEFFTQHKISEDKPLSTQLRTLYSTMLKKKPAAISSW